MSEQDNRPLYREVRWARHALHLIINGVMRAVDAYEDDSRDWIAYLFDELLDEMSGWDTENTTLGKMEGLVQDMQAMLAIENCPVAIRALLVKFDLLP